MPGGRPTKYKPEYCEAVIEMGKKGYSMAEMAAECGVDKTTLTRDWPNAHPEFSNALKTAVTLGESYYARAARENLDNHKFNTPLWSRIMGSQYKWNEKVDVNVDGNLQTTVKIYMPDNERG